MNHAHLDEAEKTEPHDGCFVKFVSSDKMYQYKLNSVSLSTQTASDIIHHRRVNYFFNSDTKDSIFMELSGNCSIF
jgi:hypothetical protein